MNRFINADGLHINIDFIKTYWQTQDGALHIELGDDDVRTVPPAKVNGVLMGLIGESHIVQVIPTNNPVYAVYRDEDGGHFADPVHYLALCADGGIYPVQCCDGWFELIDSTSNFEGVYHKDQLERFQDIEKEAAP